MLKSLLLKLSSIFLLLFITLGPIKSIFPFVELAAGAEASVVRIVAITGGITLFLTSLQMMMAPTDAARVTSDRKERLATSMLISRLVIPTIVTPPGIAAILALMVLSECNQPIWLQTMGFLLAVMALNYIAMLSARTLLTFLTVAGMRVIGWVFAVLQASLGVQIMINSLRRLGALPIL
jgi:multiple antibiotic resistance protein